MQKCNSNVLQTLPSPVFNQFVHNIRVYILNLNLHFFGHNYDE